jgi:hypothetical protein
MGGAAYAVAPSVPTPRYAGRIDDIGDFLLGRAWRAGDERRATLAYGWGASEFDVLYWAGATVATYVEVGVPPEPLQAIAYEDTSDILAGTAQTGMRADFSTVHLVLERYAYGTYPERVWTSAEAALPAAEGGRQAATPSSAGLRFVRDGGGPESLQQERMVELNLERLR